MAGRSTRFPASALDQLLYSVRHCHDAQMRHVMTFDGRIDEVRMARAVRLTLDAEPVLGCRFVAHPWRPYWERRADLEGLRLCPVVQVQDLEVEFDAYMAGPIDPCTDPLVQTRLFRGEKDTLCVKLSHMAADGKAAIDYIDLLAATYRALGVDPAYWPDPKSDHRRGLGQVFRAVGLPRLARACGHQYRLAPSWGFPDTSRTRSAPTFTTRQIEPVRLIRIQAYCHQHRVTLTDLLLAAFFRALFNILDPPVGVSLPIEVTVNLRRHLPSGRAEALCNLVGACFPSIKREPGAALDETVAQVHAAMEVARVDQAWLAGSVYVSLGTLAGFAPMQAFIRRWLQYHTARRRGWLVLTNLGMVEPGQVDFGDVPVTDLKMYGPVHYAPGFSLGAYTYRESMTVVSAFGGTATNRQTVEQVLDLLLDQLPI